METKVCTKCQKSLPIADFWMADKKRGYRRATCHECDKARMREYYASNPKWREYSRLRSQRRYKTHPKTADQSWKHLLKYKYKITPEQYHAMVESQGSKCALCNSPDIGRTGTNGKWKAGRWNIDHCHKTGRVRGLLCHKCNVRIGAYEGLLEDVGIHKVVAYLSST